MISHFYYDGAWKHYNINNNAHGPACTFIPNPQTPSRLCVIARHNDQLCSEMFDAHRGSYEHNSNNISGHIEQSSSNLQSLALRSLFRNTYNTAYQGNPMTIVSQSPSYLGHFPNAEAIVFHPCGSGWNDMWMILHWSYLTATQEWIVSGVVASEVKGAPL
ncbi:hypothetical protein GGR54DRAFT_621263 [Hypoxylon sp. NC1633]|nr:hypothetical protein GGR54DRAFT_621263 [Hypoxylon sp. NC1633]